MIFTRFDDRAVDKFRLLSTLETDFRGEEILRKQLLNKAPK